MCEIDWSEGFDGAYSFGNSFGYCDDAGNAQFLRAVWRSLKPGGPVVLDYPMVLEARLPKFQPRSSDNSVTCTSWRTSTTTRNRAAL